MKVSFNMSNDKDSMINEVKCSVKCLYLQLSSIKIRLWIKVLTRCIQTAHHSLPSHNSQLGQSELTWGGGGGVVGKVNSLQGKSELTFRRNDILK